MTHSLHFLLGLSVISDGPLWRAASALTVPVRIRANALLFGVAAAFAPIRGLINGTSIGPGGTRCI